MAKHIDLRSWIKLLSKPRRKQIKSITFSAAPRQRNTKGEKATIRADGRVSDIWPQPGDGGDNTGQSCVQHALPDPP